MPSKEHHIQLNQAEVLCIYEASKHFAPRSFDLYEGTVSFSEEDARTIYGAIKAFQARGYSDEVTQLGTVQEVCRKFEVALHIA